MYKTVKILIKVELYLFMCIVNDLMDSSLWKYTIPFLQIFWLNKMLLMILKTLISNNILESAIRIGVVDNPVGMFQTLKCIKWVVGMFLKWIMFMHQSIYEFLRQKYLNFRAKMYFLGDVSFTSRWPYWSQCQFWMFHKCPKMK